VAEHEGPDLYKDIFLFHWKEEATHAIMDELERPREDVRLTLEEIELIRSGNLKAFRWQYIFSGVDHPRYQKAIASLITEAQGPRIIQALAPLS